MPPTATNTPERTCSNCPSFVTGTNQTRLIGSNIGSPICGSRMLPLLMPTQSPDTSKKVLRNVAKGCSTFGKDVTFTALSDNAHAEMRVGMDAEASEKQPEPEQSGASCMTCSHFVPSMTVRLATGWTGAICKRNGWLMPEPRLDVYARKCGTWHRQAGIRVDPLRSFTLFPQFSKTFGEIDVTRQYESSLDNFVDPTEYKTDRPVSDNARMLRGIRAWRKVEDPKGYGEPVYLPVFDREAKVWNESRTEKSPLFDEESLTLIPKTGEREAPEQYADHGGLLYTIAVLWMKLDETPAAWGMGGTGKTELHRYLAWLMQLPLRIAAIEGSSEIDSIAGKMLFLEGETKPHWGVFPKAWTNPNVFLIDEPNTGPAEVWQFIRSLTDMRQTMHLAHLLDEHLGRHVDCYMSMAMNPQWHPLNIGALTVGDADISRLSHVYFDYPPRDLEMAILQRRVKRDGWDIPSDKLEKLMDVANEIRAKSNSGIIHTSWGLRHQIKLARSLRWFDPVTAYRRAVGDALEPSQWEEMMTSIQSHFGE